MWKEFFYYTRRERQGVIVLVLLIFAAICVGIFLPSRMRNSELEADETFDQEYSEFVASLSKQKKDKNNSNTILSNKIETKLTAFDPNTADSLTLLQLGLSSQTTKNILNYRRKGGKFRRPEDFRKIYGLTEELYTTLLPYMYFAKQESIVHDAIPTPKNNSILIKNDTLRLVAYKYPPGTVVDLNKADTTELKKIPGIGSGIAKTITNYRKRLGGFYTIHQLADINLDIQKLEDWFRVSENETNRINLNKVSVEHLKEHPYFNFYQAKVIIEHRKKKGKLKKLEQLSLYEEFTKQDLERIKYYICFE
ncbi:helix-hairpin-helix domain-containing protein [Bacteroides sp. 224]|uniref:helix-hairpin-helix domain-containing protein n=1 Tax=Bacteroides sp. 224 TaxID=2302936 RepID=UPI0013CFD297|nr:helix-hairpin-helix domain-containing protein [Bacteroides sp. 224]NDV66301.1 helix-hairpin-helix domain-containing protein [Bacteroides sp. 224]